MSIQQPVILQVLPELRSGGVERGTIEIARAIRRAGGVAIVASSGGPLASQLAHTGIEHITMPLASKNPLTIWLNSRRLATLIRQRNVGIIHARSRAPAWSAWMAARKTGCHFITTFHGTYSIQNKWKKRYNSIMARGERVIAISEFIAYHVRMTYGVEYARLRVIHRGVDLKLFNPATFMPQRMIELAREWRLPDDNMPLILFPGRITRWKGQDVFLKALAALPHRNFFAVILGDDKRHELYRLELEELIVQLGLEGHVRIARHTYYITEAYMLARLVVATSIEPEAFGRVVLEAQAMGKPVIATNHGGAMETIVPNVTGQLVTPGDIDELSAAIKNVLSLDDATLKLIGEHGIANAQNFSLDKMSEQTLGLYGEIIDPKGTKS